MSIYQLIKKNTFPYTINRYLKNRVKIYLHFLIFHHLLRLKLFGNNKCIKVDNKSLNNFKMLQNDMNYVVQLFKLNGKPKL